MQKLMPLPNAAQIPRLPSLVQSEHELPSPPQAVLSVPPMQLVPLQQPWQHVTSHWPVAQDALPPPVPEPPPEPEPPPVPVVWQLPIWHENPDWH